MKDSLTLGPTPSGEECQQIPYTNPQLARKECQAFVAQLIRAFGRPPEGAKLRVSHNPHEFGTYYEVEVVFDGTTEEGIAYAYRLEANTPELWDAAALDELGITQKSR